MLTLRRRASPPGWDAFSSSNHMQKLVFLIWKRPDLSADEFKSALSGKAVTAITGAGGSNVSINVVDEGVAGTEAVRITKFDPPIAGSVSLWVEDGMDPSGIIEILSDVAPRCAGYLVEESVPIENTSHVVAPGQRTPGINWMSCIERPAWISREDWLDRWLVDHRTVAVETQCTFYYVRNVVIRPVTEDAPPWAGIVEEGFPSEAITDPMIWYRAGGSDATLQRNIARMIESCQAFLDLDRVESNPMSHYRMTS